MISAILGFDMLSPSTLIALAKEQGFPAAAVVRYKDLTHRFKDSGLPPPLGLEFFSALKKNLFEGEIPDSPGGAFLVCAYPCYVNEDMPGKPEGPAEPSGLLAAFARGNYYKESVARLKIVRRRICEYCDLKPFNIRIYCNSRLPEKMLAVLSGLGLFARNSLVINPVLGSMFVIAGLYIPVDFTGSGTNRITEPLLCESCDKCLLACPAGAIRGYAKIDGNSCLQSLATRTVVLPDRVKELWGRRIYGCQVCQDVCPYNESLTPCVAVRTGWLGTQIPLRLLLSRDDAGLKKFLKNSVLDRAWIDLRAIKRNALIACGHCRSRELLSLVDGYTKDVNFFIRDAARWAAEKINKSVRDNDE